MEPVIPLTVLTLGLLGLEKYRLARALAAVPVRVHVNGTRGKSTTVRLVAAMCRAAGIRTVAKVTGGAPRSIDPAGAESVWPRRGPARLSEQRRFWRLAADAGAGAAVLECMAVDPALQWVAERHMAQATHTVITNVRPDHHEAMGHTLEQIACSLANTVPAHGQLILGDEAFFPIFAHTARLRGSEVRVVTEADRQALARQIPESVTWERAFLENAATAWWTARCLGVAAAVAIDTLRRWPRPAPLLYKANLYGSALYVLNALAANDPVSAASLWRAAPADIPLYALYAHRSDRPLRLAAFLAALCGRRDINELLVTGAIARRHCLLSEYTHRLRQEGGPPVTAAGTGAVLRRLQQLLAPGGAPFCLLLLGNELGLPPALADLSGPAA